ncbi:hypothetical protein ACUJ46_08525 [Sandaracinobacteroides sp. A072]|uniref:hypothetical protein n=1 Tax=Sandaracinobacteroides sp. A072 TaxID=3461146 RepID=UPI0040435C4A
MNAHRISRIGIAGSLLLLGLLLLWPAMVARSPLQFFDTEAYLNSGEAVARQASIVLERLMPAEPATSGGGAVAGAEDSRPSMVRSLYYSAFAWTTAVAVPPEGFLTLYVQALVIVTLLALLLDRAVLADRRGLALAGGVLVLFTALPFHVSWIMPDIWAAALILVGLIVVRGTERLKWGEALFLFIVSSFSIAAHYGHQPLAAGLAFVVLLLLALRRRLGFMALALMLAPLAAAMVANMAASAIAFDEVSTAPKRLPILLARSLVDGPARWHLEDACPEADYELCKGLEDLPRDLGGLLWEDGGVAAGRSDAELDRIRAEEPVILWRSFRDYPLQQSWSLAGNAVSQLALVGLDDFHWAPLRKGPDGKWLFVQEERDRTGLDALGLVISLVVAGAAFGLAILWLRGRLDPARREADQLILLLSALLINAVIFGGLSAPVDRYQGRIAWLLPALLLAFWLSRRADAAHGKAVPA